ncbi:MAG: hypothetical protein V7K89_00185 [Nostoc sp.]|uniref:hypothetical protein n=1 Tax=Nostoc sp. TaxID=1180 RepID=UPI002FF4F243
MTVVLQDGLNSVTNPERNFIQGDAAGNCPGSEGMPFSCPELLAIKRWVKASQADICGELASLLDLTISRLRLVSFSPVLIKNCLENPFTRKRTTSFFVQGSELIHLSSVTIR